MPPRRRASCQICEDKESRYLCPECKILYCSVSCYKTHKESSCSERAVVPQSEGTNPLMQIDTPTAGVDAIQVQGETRDSGASGIVPIEQEVSASSYKLPDSATTSIEIPKEGRTPGENPEQKDNPQLSKPPLRPLTSLKWPYIPEAPSYPDPLTRDEPKSLSLSQYEAIATSPAVRRALSSHPRLPRILKAIDVLRGSHREEALQKLLGVSPPNATPTSSHQRRPYASSGAVDKELDSIDDEDIKALSIFAEAVERAVRAQGDKPESEVYGLDWEDQDAMAVQM